MGRDVSKTKTVTLGMGRKQLIETMRIMRNRKGENIPSGDAFIRYLIDKEAKELGLEIPTEDFPIGGNREGKSNE